MTEKKEKAPKHLQAETQKWWLQVVADYELEPHHIRLLTLAAESWDRGQQARRALADAGSLVFIDRFKQPHPRPECSIQRDAEISFARLLRELSLDLEPPPETPRPTKLGGR